MKPLKFRKKPIVVEALQLENTKEDIADALRFLGSHPVGLTSKGLRIKTLEGTMLANWGDWVIRGTKGEFYPCKPGPFGDTFEMVL